MKIHFTASITGKKLYQDNYIRIVTILKKLGYQVSDQITNKEKKDIENLSSKQLNENFEGVLSSIKKADVVVAEVSYSSTSVAFEVVSALNLSKKVLLVHEPTGHTTLLEANKDRNMSVCEYKKDNLEEKITESMKKVEREMDVRFNFFIPKNLLTQLDKVLSNEGVANKSEYIRRLIEKDMKKNKRYMSIIK